MITSKEIDDAARKYGIHKTWENNIADRIKMFLNEIKKKADQSRDYKITKSNKGAHNEAAKANFVDWPGSLEDFESHFNVKGTGGALDWWSFRFGEILYCKHASYKANEKDLIGFFENI